MSSRSYRSDARAESARETRRRIIAAAERELLEGAYHRTSVATLAAAAGVSPQTIYNAVGSKTQVLKAVYDVLLAGDDEPIPMRDRPEFQAVLAQRSVPATMRAYARVGRLIVDRVGQLLGAVLADGAGSDVELRAFLDTIDAERRVGATVVVRHVAARFGLPEALTEQRAIDHVWTVTAPELADRLIRRSGWSSAEYEAWLATMLIAGLRPR